MTNRTISQGLIVGVMTVLMLTVVGDAGAQMRGGPGRPAHAEKIDITAMYGHRWGGNIDTGIGKFRLGTAPSWFFALDYPLAPATWVELSYGRQDGQLDLDQRAGGKTKLTDMSINHWQIGAVRGIVRGNVIPYVSTSLGLTYFSPSGSSFVYESETYALDTATKFSLTLGVGAKAFFGEAQRIGVRASFKTMPTFYNTSGGLWFGTGGASVGVTGYAIWQWEVSGGVTIRLG